MHVEISPDLYDFCGHLAKLLKKSASVRVDTSLKYLVTPSGNFYFHVRRTNGSIEIPTKI